MCMISDLIIHMQKFQHTHWLRACQLILTSAESWNWVQKGEIELIDSRESAFNQNGGQQKWGERNLSIQSLRENAKYKNTQQRKNNWFKVWLPNKDMEEWTRAPEYNFQRVYITVHTKEEKITSVIVFMWLLLLTNIYQPYRFVQFGEPFKNLLVQIYPKLHSKSYDYLYKLFSTQFNN